MRIAIISDIHGNLAATEAVMADIDRLESPVESLVSTGDVVGHFAHPNEVIALLAERKVAVIRGNYDEAVVGVRQHPGTDYQNAQAEQVDLAAVRWTRENLTVGNAAAIREWPRDLRQAVTRSGRSAGTLKESEDPAKQARRGTLAAMLVGGAVLGMTKQPKSFMPKQLLFVHGSPRDTVEYLYPGTPLSILRTIAGKADADIIVHGHTHQPSQSFVPELEFTASKKSKRPLKPDEKAVSVPAPGVTFVGVGSVGRSPEQGVAGYAVLQIINEKVEVDFRTVEYDAEREAAAVDRAGLPHELAQLLRTGRFPFEEALFPYERPR